LSSMLDVLHQLEAKENSSNWNSSSFAEEARTCSTLFAPSIQEKPGRMREMNAQR